MIVRLLQNITLAWAGVLGAALTVLAQLANAGVLSDGFASMIGWWPEVLRTVWRPPLELIGITPHPHISAVLSFDVFLIVIGIGARLDALAIRQPLPPLTEPRFLEDMSWSSLIVFTGLLLVFMFGLGSDPAEAPPLTLFGSHDAGRYAFAILAMLGYAAGDYIGHHLFHARLLRLATVVALAWAGDVVTGLA